MGRPKLYHTDEERRLAKNKQMREFYSNPENAKKNYILNQKTQSARYKRWQQNNKDKVRLRSANERAVRLQRMPKWADKEKIKEFYLNCPPGFQVDHIIPLRGKLVSGFHIVENLQYLPAKENIQKSNKFEV